MSAIADDLRERTLRFALRILALCRNLPNHWVFHEIGRQLLRAGMGVAGNYWSACRRRSDREFIAKLGVAVDEVDESFLWLTLIVRGGLRTDVETKNLLTESGEIRAILSRSHKTARENRRQRKAREKRAKQTPKP